MPGWLGDKCLTATTGVDHCSDPPGPPIRRKMPNTPRRGPNWLTTAGAVATALGTPVLIGSTWLMFSALPDAYRENNGMGALGAGIVAGMFLLIAIGNLFCVLIGLLFLWLAKR